MKRLDVTAVLSDETELKAKTTVADTTLWERTARKNKWSLSVADNPQTWETFIGWAALKRTGQTTLTYEAFCADALEITVTVPEESEEVGPTR